MSPLEIPHGLVLNPAELDIIALAYKLACAELNLPNDGDPLHTTIAKEIVALAQAGEMDPSRLSQLAIQSLSPIENAGKRRTG